MFLEQVVNAKYQGYIDLISDENTVCFQGCMDHFLFLVWFMFSLLLLLMVRACDYYSIISFLCSIALV